ncbi:MAG: LysR family transcriptional regulator [Planctomycetes bacterium]|nr:LysR family transcriptional regulator [Planctomycetota bacterium]
MYSGTYRSMELNVKIWLSDDQDHGFLGEGRFRLLREVQQTGSLTQAARKLDISYRKAWGDIRSAEQGLGFELLTRQRGGSEGGASSLNDRALKLLKAYTKIQDTMKKQAQQQYKKKLEPILLDK